MIDYLAIGHVTEDLWKDRQPTAGGTVMYASRCARALLPKVAVLTAAAAGLDEAGIFPGIAVHRVDSPRTTQFWNVYDGSHRTQYTNASPVVLGAEHFNAELRDSAIVHLAPVCNEVAPSILREIPDSAFVGLTPQGWLRRWKDDGRVEQHPRNWTDAATFLKRADAVVMSIEDINGDWATARDWANQARLMVVTQSELGCTLYIEGEAIRVPAPQVRQVDPTGAGDVFAATFFIALRRGELPMRATQMANCLAAQSVTRPQLEGLPNADDIALCMGT